MDDAIPENYIKWTLIDIAMYFWSVKYKPRSLKEAESAMLYPPLM